MHHSPAVGLARLLRMIAAIAASLVLAPLGAVLHAADDPAAPAPRQFRFVKDAFPGPTFWTEAVALGDVDGDSDLDVLFARGEGWNDPGRKHQVGLYVNRLESQPLKFEDALADEERRVRENWEWMWRYRGGGFYAQQLRRYVDLFGKDRIKVFLVEDLKNDRLGVLRSLFEFLGVDPAVEGLAVKEEYNAAGVPRSRKVHELLTKEFGLRDVLRAVVPKPWRTEIRMRVARWNLVREEMRPATRRMLIDGYREDLRALEGMLDRDLSAWMRV